MIVNWRLAAVALAALFAAPASAQAGGGSPVVTEHHRVLNAAQIVIVLSAAFALCHFLRRKLKWPALIGELTVGLLLGPTVFGRLWPQAFQTVFPEDPVQHALLDGFASWGVAFLLLAAGMHISTSAAIRRRRSALSIGVLGVLIPWVLGYGLTLVYIRAVGYTPPLSPHIFAAFLGIVMAISAMVIITRLLHELDLTGTHFGQTVLCAYAVNDVLAWLVFSALFQLAASGSMSLGLAALKISAVFAGSAAILAFAPRLMNRLLLSLRERAGERGDSAVLKAVFVFSIGLGVLTHALGLTYFFGVFVAGVVVSENLAMTKRLREILTAMAEQIMVPVYFIYLGLSVDVGTHFNLGHVVFVTAASIALKYVGAWLSAVISGRPRWEWSSIGIAFTPSGVTGIVLADVALQAKLIDQSFVVAIIFSALISTLVAGPWLRSSLAGLMKLVEGRAVPRLHRIVSADPNRLHELHGTNREEAVKQLCRLAAAESGIAPDWRTLFDKAGQYAGRIETELGEGLGFVHARLHDISRPVLVLGWSPAGITWRNTEERPVRLVLLMLLPKTDPRPMLLLHRKTAQLIERLGKRQLYSAHSRQEAERILVEEMDAVEGQQ